MTTFLHHLMKNINIKQKIAVYQCKTSQTFHLFGKMENGTYMFHLWELESNLMKNLHDRNLRNSTLKQHSLQKESQNENSLKLHMIHMNCMEDTSIHLLSYLTIHFG